MEKGGGAGRGARCGQEGLSLDLSHIVIVLLIAAFVFRKPLGRLLARQFPNRAKRQQVLGTIIAAFVLVIALRLAALLW